MATGTQKLGACLCKGIRDSDVKSSRTSWPRGQNFVLVLKDLSSALASRICPRLTSLIRDYLRHTALQLKHKRENVAINDVLPLKAARRDAIANLKCFWGLGHKRPNFDGYICIHYAAPPYSARISAIYFLPFDNVWLGLVSVCSAWEAQRRIYEGWMRTLILF